MPNENKTTRCECGAMSLEDCAWMPTRHCGLWDQPNDNPATDSPAEQYVRACIELRAATRNFAMAQERLRAAEIECERLEAPDAE